MNAATAGVARFGTCTETAVREKELPRLYSEVSLQISRVEKSVEELVMSLQNVLRPVPPCNPATNEKEQSLMYQTAHGGALHDAAIRIGRMASVIEEIVNRLEV